MRNLVLIITSTLLTISLFFTLYTMSIIGVVFSTLFLIIFLLVLSDVTQTQHSLKRNFPLLARLRWVFEDQRDKIRQYFNESDLDGTPYNREQRSIIYQRSKGDQETVPFGTQLDVYEKGYEYVKHSIFPKEAELKRVMVGSKDCIQPYNSSILNISAMSYGSLSGAAVRALNLGAKKDNFAHNTGEGGISPHHLQGGDLIFQIGTGYFGAGITENGVRKFHGDTFKVNSRLPQVKMIEVKLSQGAKPGHGGILPGKKNTKEIAEIRGVEPYTTVKSPSSHTSFNDFNSMVDFIKELRDLSGGKPVGIKLCVTTYDEIEQMVSTFKKRDIYPDFITVDGSEGGTGSAPLEYTNHMGTPLIDGLKIVVENLQRYGLKDEIKVFGSGKLVNSFDIIKVMSLGADGVNMARPFMFSLGCIQARECNKDTCPVGVATQNKRLEKGLVVEDKFERVARFHKRTLDSVKEMLGSMGFTSQEGLHSRIVIKNEDKKELL
jgi:glutamate synthase domain-containing protein 2